MPDAFKNIGLLFGTMGTIFIGIVCAHCTHLVVSLTLLLMSLWQGLWSVTARSQEQPRLGLLGDALRLSQHRIVDGLHGYSPSGDRLYSLYLHCGQ